MPRVLLDVMNRSQQTLPRSILCGPSSNRWNRVHIMRRLHVAFKKDARVSTIIENRDPDMALQLYKEYINAMGHRSGQLAFNIMYFMDMPTSSAFAASANHGNEYTITCILSSGAEVTVNLKIHKKTYQIKMAPNTVAFFVNEGASRPLMEFSFESKNGTPGHKCCVAFSNIR